MMGPCRWDFNEGLGGKEVEACRNRCTIFIRGKKCNIYRTTRIHYVLHVHAFQIVVPKNSTQVRISYTDVREAFQKYPSEVNWMPINKLFKKKKKKKINFNKQRLITVNLICPFYFSSSLMNKKIRQIRHEAKREWNTIFCGASDSSILPR